MICHGEDSGEIIYEHQGFGKFGLVKVMTFSLKQSSKSSLMDEFVLLVKKERIFEYSKRLKGTTLSPNLS